VPFDTRELADGPHVLTAAVVDVSGPTYFVQAAFQVSNPTQ
jgi:hypothetical protein